jgi:hypothetical protein
VKATLGFTAETIALNSNTRETTPFHIWITQVFDLAKVSREDAGQYCGHDRINRWANDNMPVWMAASSLRKFVADGKRHERYEREADGLANILINARTAGKDS